MEAFLWTMGAVALVSLVSLSGALTISFGLVRNHRFMMALVALAAGTLMGDAFLHLLPEAGEGVFSSRVAGWALGGFVGMFLLEVILRRSHSHVELAGHDHAPHGHPVNEFAADEPVAPFGWLNLVGDALHNLIDGVILAAAFIVDTSLGVATSIAVLLHEVPQELGDYAVLVRSGMAPKKALALNLGSALFAVLGALGVFAFDITEHATSSIIVPLVAGAFIYVAASDLVPEMHHHSKGKDAIVILVAFMVGLALMVGLLGLEGLIFPEEHAHDH